VNVRVPDNAPSGDSVPVVITVSGAASNTVTVAIQGQAGLVLQGLALSSNSITAGASVTGTVTLSGADPKGGTAVTLQSSSTAAQLPAGGSVTVPAGQTSATFTITTQAVSAAQNVTITASYGGVSKTATLTVNPAQGGSQPGKVVVLTRSIGDATVRYYQDLLRANGISYTNLSANQVATADLSSAVIIAGFTEEPTEYRGAPATAVLNAVKSGSRITTSGYGHYILSYAGVGTVKFEQWVQVSQYTNWFVKAIDSSFLFQGLNAWDPPALPNRTANKFVGIL
jgi:hypothetical protein